MKGAAPTSAGPRQGKGPRPEVLSRAVKAGKEASKAAKETGLTQTNGEITMTSGNLQAAAARMTLAPPLQVWSFAQGLHENIRYGASRLDRLYQGFGMYYDCRVVQLHDEVERKNQVQSSCEKKFV